MISQFPPAGVSPRSRLPATPLSSARGVGQAEQSLDEPLEKHSKLGGCDACGNADIRAHADLGENPSKLSGRETPVLGCRGRESTLDAETCALQKQDVHEVANLAPREERAELVREDLLGRIDEDAFALELPRTEATHFASGSKPCRAHRPSRNSQNGRRSPSRPERRGQRRATSAGLVKRQTSVSRASRRMRARRRSRSSSDADRRRSSSSATVIGSSQRK